MRKNGFLLLIICLLLNFLSQAQNNLQFNRVVFIEITYPYFSGNYDKDTIITVPNNKVWKVESAGANSTCTDGNSWNYSSLIKINDIIIAGNYGESSTTKPYVIQFPIWLSSKSYKLTIHRIIDGATIGCASKGFISAIEYNIVP